MATRTAAAIQCFPILDQRDWGGLRGLAPRKRGQKESNQRKEATVPRVMRDPLVPGIYRPWCESPCSSFRGLTRKAVDENGSDDISVPTCRAIKNGRHETDI